MREAWSEFARAIEAAGAQVWRSGDSPRVRADGIAYLAGLVEVALQQQLHGADPARPRFVANPSATAKWGAENADNRYLWAPLDPAATYCVRGRRGSSFELLFEVKEGFMQLGAPRNFASRAASAMETAKDGGFELWLGGPERAGNWLPIDPAARWLLVREYFLDWEREAPAQLAIERIGRSHGATADGAVGIAERLRAAATWIDGTLRFWNEWVTQIREAHRPGHLAPARRYEGGADDILYGNDWFRVREDEALVVTCAVPDARYWQFQLCDSWFRSLDYANHQTSLNAAQLERDPDGRVRIVVASRDPGVANWLDTTGLCEGVLQYRFIWATRTPRPTANCVALENLSGALPPTTRRIPAEQRHRILSIRQRHVARR